MIYKRKGYWHMDVSVNGVRYREALKTTDWREAQSLVKVRVAEIQGGKGASQAGRDFARLAFGAAADRYLAEKMPHVSGRTAQFEAERLKPLRRFFGDRPVFRIKADDIAHYQAQRRGEGISGRTANMEVGVLRRLMTRGKVWSRISEDVRMDRESTRPIAKVLSAEQKRLLFQMACTRPGWLVAHCAAVLAASTTCRGVELRGLRWRDVDLFDQVLHIRRSKNEAGHRDLPLNGDALAALARLRKRAEDLGASGADHFVFPTCENGRVDAQRPQKGWRTAWKALVRAAAREAGRAAALQSLVCSRSQARARSEYRAAAAAFDGFRFHDLRHQAITELAEGGASDQTLMALAGHMSRRMMEHYSHVRMKAKREALAKLECGLMRGPESYPKPLSEAVQ